MKWGEAGEDMTRGRPSRAAEGGEGGGKGGGQGVRVYSTVQYTYKLHVYKQGGGGGGRPAGIQPVGQKIFV
jgi:hypothetical protein